MHFMNTMYDFLSVNNNNVLNAPVINIVSNEWL